MLTRTIFAFGNGKPPDIGWQGAVVAVGHWAADGVMDWEYLLRDNLTFMAQTGLGK